MISRASGSDSSTPRSTAAARYHFDEAVAAEARQVQDVEVLDVGALAKVLHQPAERRRLDLGAGRVGNLGRHPRCVAHLPRAMSRRWWTPRSTDSPAGLGDRARPRGHHLLHRRHGARVAAQRRRRQGGDRARQARRGLRRGSTRRGTTRSPRTAPSATSTSSRSSARAAGSTSSRTSRWRPTSAGSAPASA